MATYDLPSGGTDSVSSNTTQTTVSLPRASLVKTVIGARTAGAGDSVQYRLAYGNTSPTATVANAVLIDSLPAGLEYRSARPAATVNGRELRWDLGDLAPGAGGTVDLTVGVASGVQDTSRVRNTAQLTSRSINNLVALSEAVALIGPPSRSIAVTQTAAVLETGLGESAPFSVVVRNTGSQRLLGLVVRTEIPDGVRYVPGSATGVDSARVSGRTVEFFVAGPLQSGASAALHYGLAIVSTGSSSVSSRTYAVSDSEQVRSLDVQTTVRVRRGFAMENRSVIGKVWVDRNGNGIQDDGEGGVERAEVWTDDGEIATTDSMGRFSYRNLRPGHHAFRLDPASLPSNYVVAATSGGADLVTRDATGWTTPTVNFRLLDRGGQLASVRLPIAWSVATTAIGPRSPAPASDVAAPIFSGTHPSVTESGSAPVSSAVPVAAKSPLARPNPARTNRGARVMTATAGVPDLRLPRVDAAAASFAFGRSTLSAASLRALMEIADSLRAHPAARAVITGHTDAVGSRRFNLKLSVARAMVVRRVLRQAGIAPARLVVRGFGPDRPVATNRSALGRSRNRRWEITALSGRATDSADDTRSTRPARVAVTPRAEKPAAPANPSAATGTVSVPENVEKPAAPVNQPAATGAVPAQENVPNQDTQRTAQRQYLTKIRNQYAVSLDGLTLRFPQPLDSVVVMSGDSTIARGSGSTIVIPAIAASGDVRVIGWGRDLGETSGVVLERGGRVLDVATASSTDSVSASRRITAPEFRSESLPDLGTVPISGEVELAIAAPAGGWRGTGTYAMPSGWELIPDSLSKTPAASVIRDRSGSSVLLWQFGSDPPEQIVLRMRPATSAKRTETVRTPALRSTETRTAEKRREFLDGPGVAFTAPGDGEVAARDRIYVGVRGESGATVSFFDGDSLLERTNLRIDGQHDFIAVPLAPGPHRLRISMRNSSGNERWDSVAVHITGPPASFVAESARTTLLADGQTVEQMRVRVFDQWGVPVVNRPEITVATTGVQPVDPDANGSSVGLQAVPDSAGWLTLRLRPGTAVMRGTVALSWSKIRQDLSVDIIPATQPLLLVGVGRVGVGASADAFGTLTARGRLDSRTSIVASFDSRRLDAGRDAFGRVADPLEATQYAILGDASAQRTTGSSRYKLSARVERGFDWLALGDISTAGFASGLQLSGYRRALPGVATQIRAGGISWQGFGSSTTQRLRQMQTRGAGISGPYRLARNVREGTEQVALETRAAENATRVLSRQVLTRFVDYQIDYVSGDLLFKQPVPAMDGYGNSVFIVVLYESESGGPRSGVWGVRGAVDANQWLRGRGLDSMRVGTTMVQEAREAGGHRLIGADVRLLRARGLELTGEAAWSRVGDSSGVATSLNGRMAFFGGAATLTGAWMNVGREFGNPSNASVQGGTREYRFGGELRQGTRQIQFSHEWQQFGTLGLDRRRSAGAVTENLGKDVEIRATMTGDRFAGLSSPAGALGGELRLQWKPQPLWTLFTEGRRQFSVEGANLQPDFIGVGASLGMYRNVSLDMRHRVVFLPGDSAGYSVSEMGVRTRLGAGSEAYGKYQIAGVDGLRNAALVGLRNRLALTESWTVNALMERRKGVGRSSVFDPVRSLPFVQNEEDYWSIGLGSEFVKSGSPLRMSARGEMRNGDVRSTRLLTIAGDASFSRSLALLSRQEVLGTAQSALGVRNRSHRYSSVWGLAYRPVESDALNLLGKVDWIDVANADGGGSVLTGPTGETRAIAAGEAIWRPLFGTEMAARYAFRRASGSVAASDGTMLPLMSTADFVGWRGSRRLRPNLEMRANGRLLIERATSSRRFDVAPELAFMPQPALEIVSGYRLGNLRDPDFAVDGGPGWFLTFGARISEGTVNSAADFWRQRLGGR